MNRLITLSTRKRGFSILELLIAVIIIGILAAILIPLIASRTQAARIASAESDLDRIGSALDQFAIDTGYYPRLFLLNDVPGPARGVIKSNPDGQIYDSTQSLLTAGYYFENIDNNLFISTTGDTSGEFVGNPTNSILIDRLILNETEFNYNGPYINWQKDFNAYPAWGTAAPDGLPDDPWGNNYLLFTREGLVLEPEGIIVGSANFPLSNNNSTGGTNCLVFDRTTILSLGPDGSPGSGGTTPLGTGDDIFRQYGP
ncbi:MAG: prepilin-type N-terminal cleavage/methylation domain-containing protein [Sumerlaeia bacterium]